MPSRAVVRIWTNVCRTRRRSHKTEKVLSLLLLESVLDLPNPCSWCKTLVPGISTPTHASVPCASREHWNASMGTRVASCCPCHQLPCLLGRGRKWHSPEAGSTCPGKAKGTDGCDSSRGTSTALLQLSPRSRLPN